MNNTTNTLISSIVSGDKAGSSDMFNTMMEYKYIKNCYFPVSETVLITSSKLRKNPII